jgi:hypothetical protein
MGCVRGVGLFEGDQTAVVELTRRPVDSRDTQQQTLIFTKKNIYNYYREFIHIFILFQISLVLQL